MSDSLKDVLAEISNPWDMLAAAVGGASGFYGSLHILGADGGSLAAGGALAGVTLRRAALASLQPSLKKRGKKLIQEIHILSLSQECDKVMRSKLDPLQKQIVVSLELFSKGIKKKEHFEQDLDKFIRAFETITGKTNNAAEQDAAANP